MTPKEWINHVRWLEANDLVICDGSSAGSLSDLGFSVLYPLFILSGMGIFLWLFMNWRRIRERF